MPTGKKKKDNKNGGGRYKTPHGYTQVLVGRKHPLADCRGYAYEHRLHAEAKIGRALQQGEQVHHINGIRDDNRHENLEVLTAAEHGFAHRKPGSRRIKPGEQNELVGCECRCGAMFWKYDGEGRPRRFVSGHNLRMKGA